MTDPEMADATYIEPIRWQTVERIIAKEKTRRAAATMGGQTRAELARWTWTSTAAERSTASS